MCVAKKKKKKKLNKMMSEKAACWGAYTFHHSWAAAAERMRPRSIMVFRREKIYMVFTRYIHVYYLCGVYPDVYHKKGGTVVVVSREHTYLYFLRMYK